MPMHNHALPVSVSKTSTVTAAMNVGLIVTTLCWLQVCLVLGSSARQLSVQYYTQLVLEPILKYNFEPLYFITCCHSIHLNLVLTNPSWLIYFSPPRLKYFLENFGFNTCNL